METHNLTHPVSSPVELLDNLRAESEDSALRTHLEVKRWLAIVAILFPAAVASAAGGNQTMRAAMSKILPLLPK